MKESDLYREWARVLDMCEGTNVDLRDCWKYSGINVKEFPRLDGVDLHKYKFAVAILEDKPVFVGNVIYAKTPKEIKYDVVEKWAVADGYNSHPHCAIDDSKFSWQPPKAPFTLNGEELPCPGLSCDRNTSGHLTIRGVNEIQFTFHNKEDRNKVAEAIIKILKDATK